MAYDVGKAFDRIENDLFESMMRNFERHKVAQAKEGMTWDMWQALQLQELDRYRKENLAKFQKDFAAINTATGTQLQASAGDGYTAEDKKLAEQVKKGNINPANVKDDTFARINDGRLNAMIEATKADFNRAEFALLRKADDMYRHIIFDAAMYNSVTGDYNKAIDMATKDYLKNGIQCIQYKNGSMHNIQSYAEMAIRTNSKRAYLMGEGNAHDKYGIHTVRVNKRTDACPKCVRFLGKVLVDDVYSGGNAKEAAALGVPTLSQAMAEGFLHPNCKDVYSLYIDGVSRSADPWTKDEITEIVGEYTQEQELKHAEDMADSYARMAKFSLDPANKQTYQQRADGWQDRIAELKGEKPVVPVKPVAPPAVEPPAVAPFTEAENEVLEAYASGDFMWINQYLRGFTEGVELSEIEREMLKTLESATSRRLEGVDKLWRSVDLSAIFPNLNEAEITQMYEHLMYGSYDMGAYSQSIKRRMESTLDKTIGSELREKGFMSTTVDKSVAVDFGDFTGSRYPVVIEFDASKIDLKGADMTAFDIAEAPQKERLLARDTRYKVNKISVETSDEGYRYIKVDAEIVGQGENVASQATLSTPATPIIKAEEETKIRQRIAEIKSQDVSGKLTEAEKEHTRLKEYNETYEVMKRNAELRSIDIREGLLESAERTHANIQHAGDFFDKREKELRYIYDNLKSFEDGTYADGIKAQIKDLKKQVKKVQKELDAEYNALETIIGEPNVTRLAVYGESNTTAIKHILDDAPKPLRDIWNKSADAFNPLGNKDRWGDRRKGAYYSASEDGVWLSIKSVAKGDALHPAYETVFHEYGHNIDYILNRKIGDGNSQKAFTETYKGGIFGKTIREETDKAIEKYGMEHGIFDRESAEKAFAKEIKGKYTLAERGDISDMMESSFSFDYPFGAGHGRNRSGERYWDSYGIGRQYIRVGREAFAEMYASRIANDGSWKVIQEFFPESAKIFDEIIEMGNRI